MSIPEKSIDKVQDIIIEEFSMFDDWMDRYDHLIEEGKDMPVIEEKYKKNDYLIEGCQSRVWLYPELTNGRLFFTADSDAIIVRGIIALLVKVLSGRTPDEILNTDLYFIDRIGLHQNLSPTRSNGLLAMLKQMKIYALAYKAKQDK
ncbi:MAG TPA: Fe-S metabolism protein SufE [Bacteroidales bacterium]|nr:Fe-S metabolism protein SufE [Bacteroidales bacterium]